MLLALTDCKKFEYIRHYYPIRGHSFLPCDRDFGLVKKSLNKYDRVYSLHEITEIIVKSSTKQNFIVKEISGNEILDFKAWWPRFYKKNTLSVETSNKNVPRNQKAQFSVANFHSFEYNSLKSGEIIAKRYINSEPNTFRLGLTGSKCSEIAPNIAYPTGKVPLKTAKLNDLKKMMNYIEHTHKQFYDEILLWPTTGGIDDEIDVD
ncbi:hypothetical protein LSTR_LSTR005029 [Laodelphax striatellus]|uniref:Uncharacterized protein n=1 Tax=Laodelphax striatellus TaxID=195883 RepID=A0A482WTU4_LAOST|nr:hypothetical protein LSTR_LSTR005029 [Laodelphax striatellus]